MANPFETTPPNVLQSLMQFDQGYKGMREMRQNRALDDVGDALGSGNYEDAAKAAFRAGKLDTGLALIKMKQEEGASKDFSNSLGAAFGAKPSSPLQQLMTPPAQPTGDPAAAISSIESGGRYDAKGPLITSGPMAGQQALGKFQVMASNVGPWSKEILGREVSPQEFLANPAIQDAIFKGKFGQYSQKYGPEGAARAWFAGEGGMNDLGRKDQLGTTVGDYGARFAQAAGLPATASPAQFNGNQQPAAAPTASPALPGASLAGANLQNAMPVLLQAMTNPKLPASQKALATELFKAALADSKMTDEQKEYTLYRAQGGELPFFQYKSELKKAGATNVTVNSGEKSYDNKLGSEQAQTFVDLQKSARDANGTMSTLRVMDKLIDNPNFYSGTGGQYATQIKRLLVSVGVKDAESAAPNELFQKLSNKIVLDMNGGSLGNQVSNADRSFIENTVANPSNTPQGNRQIIQMAMKIEQRKQEVAKLARDYAKSHGGRIDAGFDEQLSSWADKNPLFPSGDVGVQQPQASPQSGGSSQPQAPMQGARQAPDGKFYIQQNGQWYRVDQ